MRTDTGIGYPNTGTASQAAARYSTEVPKGPETNKHSNFLLGRLDGLLSTLSDIKQRLRDSTFSITYPREQPIVNTSDQELVKSKEDIFVNKLESRLNCLENLIEELKGIAYALEGF